MDADDSSRSSTLTTPSSAEDSDEEEAGGGIEESEQNDEDELSLKISIYRRGSDPTPKDMSYKTLQQGLKVKKYKHHNAEKKDDLAVLQFLHTYPEYIAVNCVALKDDDFDRVHNGPYQQDTPDDPRRVTRNSRKAKK